VEKLDSRQDSCPTALVASALCPYVPGKLGTVVNQRCQ